MYTQTFTLLTLVASSIAWTVPVKYVEERHVVEVSKRQADVNQLLQLYDPNFAFHSKPRIPSIRSIPLPSPILIN